MRALSASGLLRVWEVGQSLSVPQRALALLSAADPGTPADALARLTLGERDAWLIDLREQCFGSAITAVVVCPSCSQRSELQFSTATLRAPAACSDDVYSIVDAEDEVRFRAINSLDVMALADHSSDDARRALAERCVVNGNRRLTDAQVEGIAGKLREADSQAEVRIALTCPECGHAWLALFDVVSFFWREIEAWAQRTLDDVHALATAYHWSEADILEMSAWRRQQYLQRNGL